VAHRFLVKWREATDFLPRQGSCGCDRQAPPCCSSPHSGRVFLGGFVRPAAGGLARLLLVWGCTGTPTFFVQALYYKPGSNVQPATSSSYYVLCLRM
jgi:hypothetical protein